MLNQKYYPFERNRYYFGKLLTAKDFENEQTYFNNKRRLINKTVLGMGVACGLNIYAADDTSLIIETGTAIDEKGREILVEQTIIKKITTIEGFDKTTEDELYLGIEYAEQLIDKAYSPMSPNQAKQSEEYNKIKENYRLFLEEEKNIESPSSALSAFVRETIVYQNEEITLRQYIPRFANNKSKLKVKVELEKMNGTQKAYSFTYQLNLQGFKTIDGESRLNIAFNHCLLKQSQKITKEYTLIPDKQLDSELQFKISPDNFYFIKDEQKIPALNEEIKIELQVKEGDMWDWIEKQFYLQSLDAINEQSAGQKIWLAKVKLIRTNNTCLIDGVQAMPFSQYIYNPGQLILGERLGAYYLPHTQPLNAVATLNVPIENTNKNTSIDLYEYFATGIVEIPIGISASTRETIFSHEIMHGLGKGSVYIDLGIEYIREEEKSNEKSNELILGQAALFDEMAESMIKMTHAIKVYKDKGTFIIALKLQEASRMISVRVRWFAFRLPETELQLNVKTAEGKMMISPDTIVLAPHESTAFSPIFIQMEEEPCSYEVLEPEGGTITSMGVYTAPPKEGVYTIQVKSLSKEEMKAHAFVVVKQKKEEHK